MAKVLNDVEKSPKMSTG